MSHLYIRVLKLLLVGCEKTKSVFSVLFCCRFTRFLYLSHTFYRTIKLIKGKCTLQLSFFLENFTHLFSGKIKTIVL